MAYRAFHDSSRLASRRVVERNCRSTTRYSFNATVLKCPAVYTPPREGPRRSPISLSRSPLSLSLLNSATAVGLPCTSRRAAATALHLVSLPNEQ